MKKPTFEEEIAPGEQLPFLPNDLKQARLLFYAINIIDSKISLAKD